MVIMRFLGSYARQSVEASTASPLILGNVAPKILNGVGGRIHRCGVDLCLLLGDDSRDSF